MESDSQQMKLVIIVASGSCTQVVKTVCVERQRVEDFETCAFSFTLKVLVNLRLHHSLNTNHLFCSNFLATCVEYESSSLFWSLSQHTLSLSSSLILCLAAIYVHSKTKDESFFFVLTIVVLLCSQFRLRPKWLSRSGGRSAIRL